MRRRPMHNHCLDGDDLKSVLLDLLDMISGRDELPPDPDEEPLPIFDKDGNLNLEGLRKMNPNYHPCDSEEAKVRQGKEKGVCLPEREPGPDIPPHYDSELGEWTTRVDERRESGDIGYVCAEFSGAGLIYPFNTRRSRENGWHDHAHGFDGVLEALIEDEAPEAFSVEGFEEYYSEQELKMLRKVQEKLLAMKKVSGAGGTGP